MGKTTAQIALSGQRAQVKIGDRSLFVEATPEKNKEYLTPAELIISALGG